MNQNSAFIIEIKRVQENIERIFNNLKPNVQVIPVLKADAYGHGLIEIAKILDEYKAIKTLAIAQPIEALSLKEAGISKDIMLLCGITDDQIDLMIENKIQLLIHNLDSLKEITSKLKEHGIKNYPVNLKINTGLNRLGFDIEELKIAIPLLKNNQHITLRSTYSHFIEGVKENSPISFQQKKRFDEAIQLLNQHSINPGIKHMCDSGAYEWFENAHYDAVRIGRALYMDNPYKEESKRFKDVGSWRAKVISTRDINKGESIGYGQSHIAQKDMSLAIINVGYGDGMMILSDDIMRPVLINDQKAQVISVAMDQSYLDITGLDVKINDEVTLFGMDKSKYFSTNDITKQFDDEGCTLTSLLSKRVCRVYR